MKLKEKFNHKLLIFINNNNEKIKVNEKVIIKILIT